MKRVDEFEVRFARNMPSELESGTLYVSVEYATSAHLCACGCGNKVVTPLAPSMWRLIYDGVSVSLEPSVGNWSFQCQSHYWIYKNRVEWAPRWSKQRIARTRLLNRRMVESGADRFADGGPD